ncbi:MAG: non-canonical purine NTP pyrophosphatase, RdgB/HAM1 family [Candidatus Lindowbacteria bacterium RIFCSPLOWO2_12_FULL_62_27]|nr:MAG: non-canonical purine NTP pyrophosphatase, RdgB/HAM1 family [Candidatus Lindowbacteria bacterium RIFCSPLOWO2_12_FULL_62_27]OGH63660.1 MAG: non-canonical purine NTP pyrophosphatase, RdgB/HAM1 family [Candidatus Lindowbacteria bacterium RIFCSPLOWO2_02_FULL_62_12]
MIKLVLATRNRGKLSEFAALLAPLQVELELMPDGIVVAEDGKTYLENATRKASEVARRTGLQAVADDSGIEVDALDGEPGIHSARFLNGAPDGEKCARILELLSGSDRRGARFVISLVLADPDRIRFSVTAHVSGRIADQPRGTNGFGYDPIFVPEGHDETMAELSPAEKHRISHRGQAARALIRYLKDAA